MNPPGNPGDPRLNDVLLSKADALIRRNRPDGVGTEAEELPLLTDMVEDLPELTDTIDLPPATQSGNIFEAIPNGTPTITVDLEDVDSPIALDTPSTSAIDHFVREAVERTRTELMATHEQALEEAITQIQTAATAERTSAIEAALAEHQSASDATLRTQVAEARKDAWQTAAMAMSEHLIELDAYIAQSIDQWMSTELPQIISTEMTSMVDRLRSRANAHLRATLIPQLSEKLSSVLDSTLADNEPPR